MSKDSKPVLHYFDLGSKGRGEVVRYVRLLPALYLMKTDTK